MSSTYSSGFSLPSRFPWNGLILTCNILGLATELGIKGSSLLNSLLDKVGEVGRVGSVGRAVTLGNVEVISSSNDSVWLELSSDSV